MRIVVDAMGTDERPVTDVEGGMMAAREFKDTIIFVGDKVRIEIELKKYANYNHRNNYTPFNFCFNN